MSRRRAMLVACAAVLAACGDLGRTDAEKAAADSAAVRRAPGGAPQVERDTMGGAWTLVEGRSALDDSRTVEVWLDDSRRDGEADDRPWPRLHVRCQEDRTTVDVETRVRFSPADQPEKLRDYDVSVRMRLDGGAIFAQTWREDANATDLHAPRPIAFARRLVGKRALRMEYTTYDGNTQLALFTVRGLEQWLGDVAAACHWKFP